MSTYHIDIATSVRAYGHVTVEADTPEEALEKVRKGKMQYEMENCDVDWNNQTDSVMLFICDEDENPLDIDFDDQLDEL